LGDVLYAGSVCPIGSLNGAHRHQQRRPVGPEDFRGPPGKATRMGKRLRLQRGDDVEGDVHVGGVDIPANGGWTTKPRRRCWKSICGRRRKLAPPWPNSARCCLPIRTAPSSGCLRRCVRKDGLPFEGHAAGLAGLSHRLKPRTVANHDGGWALWPKNIFYYKWLYTFPR